ncbi:hypothetical protein ACU686_20710 [Yinghuangia aomiensis]
MDHAETIEATDGSEVPAGYELTIGDVVVERLRSPTIGAYGGGSTRRTNPKRIGATPRPRWTRRIGSIEAAARRRDMPSGPRTVLRLVWDEPYALPECPSCESWDVIEWSWNLGSSGYECRDCGHTWHAETPEE